MTKRIFRSIFCVSALVLVAGLVLMLGVLYPYFNDQLEKELDREAHYLALVVESEGVDGLSELAMTEERITLVTADGEVLYDNQADESSMDNHLNREEIQEALSSGDGYAIRRSQTLAEETVYYALRLSNGTGAAGIQHTIQPAGHTVQPAAAADLDFPAAFAALRPVRGQGL